MKHQILDHNEPEKSQIHAKKSFDRFLVSASFCFISVLMTILLMLFFGMFINLITFGLALIFVLIAASYSFLGLLSGIESFKTHEDGSFRKYVGTLGNLIITIFILVAFGGVLLGFVS